MADKIKYLSNAALQQLVTEIKNADAATLQSAKDYADGLADNYDAAGTAATKVQELADGQVKTNKEAIEAINNADTGILKQAKDYADGLAGNYDAAGTAESKVNALAEGAVKTNTEAIAAINNAETGILKQAKDYADTQDNGVKSTIGAMDNLETTAKGDLVSAINEVRNAVSAGGTAAAITMTEQTTGLGDGIAKAYVLKQGDNTVGTVNIPKDMVVQSGEVVVNPEGQAAGTYIKLVLANATNDVIYVNVGTLVDIYVAKASAAQVQIAIDSATREISASIVAGSVTATELADNAVVTAKIADGNVTKAKLSTEVKTELEGKADKATTLAGYGIADAYTIEQVDSVVDTAVDNLDEKLTESINGLSSDMNDANQRIDDLERAYDSVAANKADKATTLAGYGITDAYTKADTYNQSEIDEMIDGRINEMTNLMQTADEKKVDITTYESKMQDVDEAIAAINNADTGILKQAKDYADGLNTAMDTRVAALETWHENFVECTPEEIQALFA